MRPLPLALALALAALFGLIRPVLAADIGVSPEQAAALGIETQPAAPATVLMAARLPATLVLPGSSARAVVVPFGGVVTRRLAQEGEAVDAGQALVELHSAEYLAARAAQRDRQARLEQARQQAARDTALLREGIVPARQAQQSQAALAAAQAEFGAGRDLLAATAAVGGRPAVYRLLAPAAGVVHEGELRPGEPVAAGHSAALLLSGDRLWAEAQLPPTLVGRVRAGQAVRLPGGEPAGRVIAVGRVIDPSSRAALLRAELPASGLAPGQNLEIEILDTPPAAARRVPAAAVSRDAGQQLVYVAVPGGFRAQPVEVLGRDGPDTVLLGLPQQAQVVTQGLAALKALARQEP
jgi:RND family efflux transporter MFP subunit